MTNKHANRAALVALLIGVIPAHAAAQNQSDYSRLNAERGAELSLFGGATAAGSGAAPAFGWSAGWRASARVARIPASQCFQSSVSRATRHSMNRRRPEPGGAGAARGRQPDAPGRPRLRRAHAHR